MAEINRNSGASVGQAAVILGELAGLAHTVGQLAAGILEDGSERFDPSKVAAIIGLANQAGLLSDMGAEKLGAACEVGGAEAWLLPPVYELAESHATIAGRA